MKIAAQALSPEVVDKINALLDAPTYADPNDFAVRSILRDCTRVRAVDPAFGWSLLSLYNSVIGEADEADRCFRASQALKMLPVAYENYHASLTNGGFFSKANDFFKANGHPETGMFSRLAMAALTSGSIQTFLSYYDTAVAMNMEMAGFPVEEARTAAGVLSRAGLSDEMITHHLDAAGEVLRRHRFFFQEYAEILATDEKELFEGVTCIFRLKLSADEVFELNMELAMVEEEMLIEKSPAFDVMFLPA